MATTWAKKRAQARSISDGLRSGLEEKFKKQLDIRGVKYTYETCIVYFTPAVKKHRKTWDWTLTLPSGKVVIIETKGYWPSETRLAEIAAILQNPDLDVRYVFQDSRKKIRKGSNTSYADVCRKYSIPFADLVLPQEWLDE